MSKKAAEQGGCGDMRMRAASAGVQSTKQMAFKNDGAGTDLSAQTSDIGRASRNEQKSRGAERLRRYANEGGIRGRAKHEADGFQKRQYGNRFICTDLGYWAGRLE